MDKYDGGKGQATDTLIFYFKTLFEKQGLKWNSDHESEIAGIVDCIIKAAKEQPKTYPCSMCSYESEIEHQKEWRGMCYQCYAGEMGIYG